MKVLVVGSTDWIAPLAVRAALDDAFKASLFDLTVLHTGLAGPEEYAQWWADRPGVGCETVPLDAGLDEADMCAVFVANRGVREVGAVAECRARNIPVRVYHHTWD